MLIQFLPALLSQESTLPQDFLRLKQSDISDYIRLIVIDWLTQLHITLCCGPGTLFLTVAILDRYLATETVSRSTIQMVASAALLLATKYEEDMSEKRPTISELTAWSANAYSQSALKRMECWLFKKLNYDLGFSHTLHFAAVFIEHADELLQEQLLYYLQRTLETTQFADVRPSILAAAACELVGWKIDEQIFEECKIPELKEICERLEKFLSEPLDPKFTFLHQSYKSLGHPSNGKIKAIPLVSASTSSYYNTRILDTSHS
jgi:hypothetical protein